MYYKINSQILTRLHTSSLYYRRKLSFQLILYYHHFKCLQQHLSLKVIAKYEGQNESNASNFSVRNCNCNYNEIYTYHGHKVEIIFPLSFCHYQHSFPPLCDLLYAGNENSLLKYCRHCHHCPFYHC